jgi:exopolysaccharide biosynthesis protein
MHKSQQNLLLYYIAIIILFVAVCVLNYSRGKQNYRYQMVNWFINNSDTTLDQRLYLYSLRDMQFDLSDEELWSRIVHILNKK